MITGSGLQTAMKKYTDISRLLSSQITLPETALQLYDMMTGDMENQQATVKMPPLKILHGMRKQQWNTCAKK